MNRDEPHDLLRPIPAITGPCSTNAQWLPWRVTTVVTCGYNHAAAEKARPTKGSSSAVRISAGTRMRSTPHGTRVLVVVGGVRKP